MSNAEDIATNSKDEDNKCTNSIVKIKIKTNNQEPNVSRFPNITSVEKEGREELISQLINVVSMLIDILNKNLHLPIEQKLLNTDGKSHR